MPSFRHRLFSSTNRLIILNAILISIAVITNIYFQVFCIPSTWSMIVLIICFGNVMCYPAIKEFHKLLPLTSFINGFSFCVFIYCILFLGNANYFGLLGIFFFGIGIITFIPHFFVIQIFWVNVIKPSSKIAVRFFISGILIFLLIALYFGYEYRNAVSAIKEFKESNYQGLDKSFMTEKILGMHFIYHTRFCEYDGWRPPIHEPALVMGMWLNGMNDPLSDLQYMKLDERIALYKRFYPENKLKFECSCAIVGSDGYQNDNRLQ